MQSRKLKSNSKVKKTAKSNSKTKLTKKFTIPTYISKEQHKKYLEASKLYKDTNLINIIDAKSEDDIYWLAVVSYSLKSLKILRSLNTVLAQNEVELTDKYYWIYLSREKSLFYSCITIEMYRRRTLDIQILKVNSFSPSSSLLINCSNLEFEFKILENNVKDEYINSNYDRVTRSNVRTSHDFIRTNRNLNLNSSEYKEILQLYHPDIVSTCNEIVS